MKNKKNPAIWITCIILILIAVSALGCSFTKDIKERTTDIAEYEQFLGEDGKYKKNFGTYNDIFPDKIPETAEVEQFCYSYFNLADPCYLGYLVYTCEEEEYEQEYDRLKKITSTEEKYIYGAKEFPYELLAVYADDYYGYIYALADEEEQRLIYIELQFCNGFTDFDYLSVIDEKYLPEGFDVSSAYKFKP